MKTALTTKSWMKMLYVTRKCKLTLVDRLVYSCLAGLARNKIILSKRQLAQKLCLDRKTVQRSLTRLTGFNLYDPDCLLGVRPSGDQLAWFVEKEDSSTLSGYWLDKYASWRMPFPRTKPIKSWPALVLYLWLVHSANDNGYIKPVSKRRLERLLHIKVRFFDQLENLGFVRHLDNKQVKVSKPDADFCERFVDKERRKQAGINIEKPWLNLSPAEIERQLNRQRTPRAQLFAQMQYKSHYTGAEIEHLQSLIRKHWLHESDLAKYYSEAEREHDPVKYNGANSFGLLCFKLDQKYNKRA